MPFAAGVPGKVAEVFIPLPWTSPKMRRLEHRISYQAFFSNLRTVKEQALDRVACDSSGSSQDPITPAFEQWLFVIELKEA